jgi:hypothetical protein
MALEQYLQFRYLRRWRGPLGRDIWADARASRSRAFP